MLLHLTVGSEEEGTKRPRSEEVHFMDHVTTTHLPASTEPNSSNTPEPTDTTVASMKDGGG